MIIRSDDTGENATRLILHIEETQLVWRRDANDVRMLQIRDGHVCELLSYM